MANKDMIVKVLDEHPCLNSFEIKGFIYRKYNEVVTPQSISGTLRPLVSAGYVGKSGAAGKMVYWLTDFGKEKLFKNVKV